MLIQGNYSVIVNLFGIKKCACADGFVLQNNKADAAVRAQMARYRYEPAGKAGIFEQFFSAHDMRACGKQDHGLITHDAASSGQTVNSIRGSNNFIMSGENYREKNGWSPEESCLRSCEHAEHNAGRPGTVCRSVHPEAVRPVRDLCPVMLNDTVAVCRRASCGPYTETPV